MKRIAVLQSNYIPWKGYFDLINCVDEFVLFDDMQYTRRDWRNRNKLKTPQGAKWLSIPVQVKGKYYQKINDTIISDKNWPTDHWEAIKHYYSRSAFFKDYSYPIEEVYLGGLSDHLSQINFRFIEIINSILGIQTKITWSTDYDLIEGRTEKLLGICQQAGAGIYVSGPAAKDYFDKTLAEKMGIQVEWMDYSGYPEYRQHHPPFEHGVSILDLIFNEGPKATLFMKTFK